MKIDFRIPLPSVPINRIHRISWFGPPSLMRFLNANDLEILYVAKVRTSSLKEGSRFRMLDRGRGRSLMLPRAYAR